MYRWPLRLKQLEGTGCEVLLAMERRRRTSHLCWPWTAQANVPEDQTLERSITCSRTKERSRLHVILLDALLRMNR